MDLVNKNEPRDPELKSQHELAKAWKEWTGNKDIIVCETLEEAMEQHNLSEMGTVLVTGSLHLVGGMMTFLNVNSD
jgi:folylpolyglutamate synthase/dihydropteroate synthase